MKDFDWELLEALFRSGSLSKAAEALYITQSAVTKRLRGIEDEWGVEVVKRSSKGVTFTEDGIYLAKKAMEILSVQQGIREHFSVHAGEKTMLRLGVPNAVARLHMPKLLKGYLQQYNRLLFHMTNTSSDMIVSKLMDGSLDMGFVCGDFYYDGDKMRLFEERLFMIAPKDVNPAKVDELPLIESYLNPMVKSIVDQWWRNHFGSMPRQLHRVPYSDIAIEMVHNGLGVSFLFGRDWDVDDSRLQIVPLFDMEGNPIRRGVWLMSARSNRRDSAMQEFVDFVKKYYFV